VRGSKRDAQTALGKLVGEVGDGLVTSGAGTTGELVERWFGLASLDWSPKTRENVRSWIDLYVIPQLGEVPLRRLSAVEIDRFYARLRTAGVSGRPLSPASVHRVHNVVHRALGQGVKWGLLARNVADDATPPKRRPTRVRPPSLEEARALIARAEELDPAFGAFLRLAATTGARRGELLGVTWADVGLDYDAADVVVRRAVIATSDGLVTKATKTDRERRVALAPATVATLRRLRAAVRSQALAIGIGAEGLEGAYVFAEPPWEVPWHPDSVSTHFARLRRSVGVSGVRLHDLRHLAATQMLSRGVDVRTVSGRLGHARPSMTLDVYGHFLPAADRDAARVMDDALDAATTRPRR
jgi:integrase